jgi:hypothetical protein
MKTKNIFRSVFCAAVIACAIIFSACDMTYIDESVSGGGNSLTGAERAELERTGRFLKLVNMPAHTQATNVFSVSVSNSSQVIGKLNGKDKTGIKVFNEGSSSTFYLPLVYSDNTEFTETGRFIVGFEILVDAVTAYRVNVSDNLLVPFTDGRGTVDVRNLPASISSGPGCLVIYNLPENISLQNISNITVHNQAGAVASCADYSAVLISTNDNRAVVRIPLSYNSSKANFTETGVFFVSFDINVDVDTRYLITIDDRVRVSFLNGNGYLDIENIPANVVPYLTIQGLPLYTTARHISNVSVYNLAGTVASCGSYGDITIFKENGFVTARVPLSSSAGGYFTDTGRFAVTFTVNVDVQTQISFTRSDNLILAFFDGSSSYDHNTFFGYFDAQLTAAEKPVIKAGSSFDVNGYRHTVSNDLPVNAYVPSESCILYLYVFRIDTDVYYEFSKTAPQYSVNRRGYYSNSKRALWKMVYLHDVNLFLFKTYVENDFPQLGFETLTNTGFNSLVSGKTAHYFLSGSENPAVETVTLQPGVYVVSLAGAGGGGGYGAVYNVSNSAVTGSSSGGTGGSVSEVLTLDTATSFSVYTASGGSAAAAPSLSGNFIISGYKNIIGGTGTAPSQQTNEYGTVRTTDTIIDIVSAASASGGPGGGGGSGTFIFCSGYFLCAGGGGGGSGASLLTPGGGGGNGGAIGPGGEGGATGSFLLRRFQDAVMNLRSSPGGIGGGNGIDALLPFNKSLNGGSGAASYSSAFFDLTSMISFLHYAHVEMRSNGGGSGGTHPEITSYGGTLSPFRALSLSATTYSISAASGSGGSVAMVSYPSGHPQAYQNTGDSPGTGGAAPALGAVNISGTFQYISGNYYSTALWDTNAFTYNSNISVSFSARAGQNGFDGGNNRNSSKGGGSPGGGVINSRPSDGQAGSVTIYKIY